jgi:hypothetical protein
MTSFFFREIGEYEMDVNSLTFAKEGNNIFDYHIEHGNTLQRMSMGQGIFYLWSERG